MPELMSQQTIGEGIELWKIETDAVNAITARQKARAYARSQELTIKNILDPKILNVENTRQAKLTEFWPERWSRERYTVEVTVVK